MITWVKLLKRSTLTKFQMESFHGKLVFKLISISVYHLVKEKKVIIKFIETVYTIQTSLLTYPRSTVQKKI
jgi:hypothetical protein